MQRVYMSQWVPFIPKCIHKGECVCECECTEIERDALQLRQPLIEYTWNPIHTHVHEKTKWKRIRFSNRENSNNNNANNRIFNKYYMCGVGYENTARHLIAIAQPQFRIYIYDTASGHRHRPNVVWKFLPFEAYFFVVKIRRSSSNKSSQWEFFSSDAIRGPIDRLSFWRKFVMKIEIA